MKLHIVTHINLFDFESHPMAYALASEKNKFGYTFKNIYYFGNKKIYEGSLCDNVEDELFCWLTFKANRNQLSSLIKKVDRICKNNQCETISESDDKFDINFQDGSTISYHGKNKDVARQLVLKKCIR